MAWVEGWFEVNAVDLGVGMFGKWVRDGVWLLWWNWYGFIVDKVLDSMSESKIIVGGVTYVLVVGTVGIRVVAGR